MAPASVGVREGGADLVGKQDRHPELFDRRADDASGGRQHQLAVNDATLSDDEADLLLRWKTVVLDADAVSAPGHVAVMIDAGLLGAWTSALATGARLPLPQ